MKGSHFFLSNGEKMYFSMICYFFEVHLYIMAVISSNDFYSSHFL